MRATILKRAWRAFGQAHFVPQSRGASVMVALLLAATNLFATVTVNWVSGGPNPDESGVGPLGAGYVDGDITLEAAYNTPCGIAADLSGNYLFVADYNNNTIRLLEFDINYTSTLFTLNGLNLVTNLFHHPIGVAIDSSYNLFVLNRGNGNNGNVLEFAIDEDLFATLVATNAANLTNAAGIALDFSDNIYVTIKSNQVLKITSPGVSNVVATVTNAGASLQGIVVKYNGLLAVCDFGRNGIYLINPTSGAVTTNAGFNGAGDFINTVNNRDPISIARFFQPTGVAETGDGSLIVTDFGNHRVKVVTGTSVTNLYGVTSNDWVFNSTNLMYFWPGFVDGTVVVPDKPGGVAARQPFGVTIAPDGSVYVTEDYYHIIRHVTGAGLKPPLYPPLAPADLTATAGYGQVTLTWTASASPGVTNYNIKRSTSSGGPYTNNIVGSTSATAYTDTNVADGTTYYYVVSAVSSTVGEGPNSLEANATPMFSPVPGNLTVTNFNFGPVILTWSMSAGATSYNVKRSTSTNGPFTTIGSPASTSYTDTSALVGTMYYYVVSAVNGGGESANSLEVSYTPPIPPPPPPEIGWFDYEPDIHNNFLTVIHAVSGANYYLTYNILNIAVDPITNGVSTYYIYTNGPQPVALSVSSLTNNGITPPPFYQDGLFFAQSLVPNFMPPMPDLVIEAVNVGAGGSSPVVTAEFLFQVGTPTIIGNNAAQFTVSDITTNVTLWYTLDGTNPTNAPPSIGPVAITNGNPVTLSLNASSNLLFQARAFCNGFSPSGIAVQSFSPSNFVPNSISFGFASGQASSAFVASPGQTFYAPVTLSILPNTVMDSLQFNLTVNSVGASAALTPGAFGFTSMLMKPDPENPPNLIPIPPYMFINYAVPPPLPGQIIIYEGTNFVNLVTYNLSLNLLGVGWLERQGKTNLFNTLSQNLLSMSIAHDDVFPTVAQPNGVIVGSYSFQVPANAAPGDTYQIQIGRPSATTDGIGDPGSSVFIFTPTNGSLGAGVINALKNVTVGQRKYIAGDAAPFGWFNAGDFGDTNLDASDVAQVFEAAVYGLGIQLDGSDLFDAMDSCGYTYVDNHYGYLQPGPFANPNVLFDGNDTTIDQIAFGDGVLDVADVYVTYRRSLDPNRVWFRRYWTNDVAHAVSGRVAEIVPNVFNPSVAIESLSAPKSINAANIGNSPVSITNQPKVNFASTDFLVTAGQTIQVPITANIFGNYPLCLLMLNLSVVPLDGSPVLTAPVTFSYNPALGSPWTTEQRGNDNYSAVWLNSGISGLTGNVSLGALTVTIPANASSSSAYAIHFDHASASPNGLASFPKQTLTGLITLSSRTNSSYGDGIPDSWRLRWFGTIYNLLSVSNACPSGDGINNWQKYVAGVDPNTPNDFPSLNAATPVPAGAPASIYWPSVSGVQYVILRSSSLFPGSWSAIATNTGTGTDMVFTDPAGGSVQFYRVLIQP